MVEAPVLNVNLQSNTGYRAIMLAVKNGSDKDIIHLLDKHGVKIISDAYGKNAIDYALEKKYDWSDETVCSGEAAF